MTAALVFPDKGSAAKTWQGTQQWRWSGGLRAAASLATSRPTCPSIVRRRTPALEAVIDGKPSRTDWAILIASIIALIAVVGLTLAAVASKADAQAAPVAQKPACKSVTAKTFNKRVRVLDQITGKRHHRASRKVCKSHFRKLLKKIRAARTTCKARARIGIASVYGPEFGDGTQTASGARLTSETIGVAHKTLPFWNRFYFYFRGRVVRAPVVDRGPFIAGRDWDLTGALMRALKFPFGVAAVTTSKTNCWASA